MSKVKEVSREVCSFETFTQDKVLYALKPWGVFLSVRENERKTKTNRINEMVEERIKQSKFNNISYQLTRHYDEIKKLMDDIAAIKAGKLVIPIKEDEA